MRRMKDLLTELEWAIGERLREMGWTLSIAESCTGGLVSDRITNISGSSDYFEGGIVSYSVQAKAQHLGIPLNYIKRFGAVSSQVARKMAEGVRQAFQTTYGLSTTGVAGPTGGTKKTPVGTVFVGVVCERGAFVEKLNLKGNRREIKESAAEKSLRFLYEQLARLATNPPIPPLSKGGRERFSRFEGDISGIAQRIEHLRHSEGSEIMILRKAPQGILDRKGRLGIFPASFNPPTMAHLALIRGARQQAHLDEVLILLDIQAMDKEPREAEYEDRLTMLKKAFGRDQKVSMDISNRGLFIEKLQPLRKYYPSPILFFFIVGFDTILRVMDKKYYSHRKRSLDELFHQCQFLVANRGDHEKAAFVTLLDKPENRKYKDKVTFLTLHPRISSISSTVVREKIAKDQPADGLVPASIHQVIKRKRLYTEK